jgi:hypothetical protein
MRVGQTLDFIGGAATRPLFLGRAQSPYGLPPPPKKKQVSLTIFFRVRNNLHGKRSSALRSGHVPNKSGLREEGIAEQEADILLDSCR